VPTMNGAFRIGFESQSIFDMFGIMFPLTIFMFSLFVGIFSHCWSP
jgi:hypothetical protein